MPISLSSADGKVISQSAHITKPLTNEIRNTIPKGIKKPKKRTNKKIKGREKARLAAKRLVNGVNQSGEMSNPNEIEIEDDHDSATLVSSNLSFDENDWSFDGSLSVKNSEGVDHSYDSDSDKPGKWVTIEEIQDGDYAEDDGWNLNENQDKTKACTQSTNNVRFEAFLRTRFPLNLGMFLTLIMVLAISILGAPVPPTILKNMQSLPFHEALRVSKVRNYFINPHRTVASFEDSLREAFRYHDAHKDGSEAVNKILDIPKKTRFKYLSHLLKNPTVDLSVDEGRLARTLVVDGDVKALGLLINHPKLDLSFDDNYLLKLASTGENSNVHDLLMQDKMVKKLLHHHSGSDDELESLSFSEEDGNKKDNRIEESGVDTAVLSLVDGMNLSDVDSDDLSQIESVDLSHDVPNSEAENDLLSASQNQSMPESEDSSNDLSEDSRNNKVPEEGYTADDEVESIDESDPQHIVSGITQISKDKRPDEIKSSHMESDTIRKEREGPVVLPESKPKLPLYEFTIDSNDSSDMESISISTDLKYDSDEEDYDWIDHDVDWEYLSSDESYKKEFKRIINTLFSR